MRVWPVVPAAGLLALALYSVAGCANPLGARYEYEEQLYLQADGSATLTIDASIPALVALRGLPLDPALGARVDREAIGALYSSSACGDVRVGQPWVRQGRHFVQVRLTTADVRQLHSCAPLSWSKYSFEQDQGLIHYNQVVGAATAGNPGPVTWSGSELVAFKLHLPSRIVYHNMKRLSDGKNGEAERGNILTWEQRLSDRRAGQPLELDVRMGSESILYRTLWLFAGAFVAAILALAMLVWLTVRRARRQPRLARPTGRSV